MPELGVVLLLERILHVNFSEQCAPRFNTRIDSFLGKAGTVFLR
jgi:hypothetical protein